MSFHSYKDSTPSEPEPDPVEDALSELQEDERRPVSSKSMRRQAERGRGNKGKSKGKGKNRRKSGKDGPSWGIARFIASVFGGVFRLPWLVRLLRWTIALILVGPTVGAGWVLWDLVGLSGAQSDFWVPFLCGAACWLICYVSAPAGRFTYVLGHELTHAIWSWMSGGRVRSIRVNSQGGSVEVTKINSLVTLAPYFFPFYPALWLLGWWIAGWWLPVERWRFSLFLGLGMTYAFHMTWTVIVLSRRQPDIEREGWAFSGVVILLLHGLLTVATLTWLTETVTLTTALGWVSDRTLRFWAGIYEIVRWSWT